MADVTVTHVAEPPPRKASIVLGARPSETPSRSQSKRSRVDAPAAPVDLVRQQEAGLAEIVVEVGEDVMTSPGKLAYASATTL